MFQFPRGISFSHVMDAVKSLKYAIQSKKPENRNSGQNINQKEIPAQSVNQGQISAQHTGHDPQPETPGQETPEQTDRLDPASIPKFVNQLVKPPVYMPLIKNVKTESSDKKCYEKRHQYLIDICEFEEQILPEGFPKTKVWGYGGLVQDKETGGITYSRSSPGGTFEAVRGIPVMINWRNVLNGKHPFAVDPTLHWANPNNIPMHPPVPWPLFPPGFPDAQFPVPSVTHLHGAEVSSHYDGHPDAWYTSSGKQGPACNGSMYLYPNSQEPATLWYHDHSLGMTRLGVYAGLAGFYLLRDPDSHSWEKLYLPDEKYEIPLLIQDRSFRRDGSLVFNEQGINPEMSPYWVPGFGGNTIMVNGRVWPNLDVERRQYRFRVLNGSNSRFYNLKLSNGMRFTQIGTDGGFLPEPAELDTLLIAPAERADILMDFSGVDPGTSIILLNDAPAPFPDGFPPDENTTGQVMRFNVPADYAPPVKPQKLPCRLSNIAALKPDSPDRVLTLTEIMGPNGPAGMFLNGQRWADPISETPRVGSTEDWVIVNIAGGSHPIHLHLIQFQIIDRQEFNAEEYLAKWEEINGTGETHGMNRAGEMREMNEMDENHEMNGAGEINGRNEAHSLHEGHHHTPRVIPVEPYLIGDPIPPDRNERGWKDTAKIYPNQVLRIRVRFAPQDVPVCDVKPGENRFPFDPSEGPGYVWHCHILDHEDNEMMRPLKVLP